MRKVWAVIRREFIERVRTKWFLVSTILGPIFMIAMAVLPGLLLSKGSGVSSIVIVDENTGQLASRVQTQVTRSGKFSVRMLESDPDRRTAVMDSLTREVQRENVDGYLVLSNATLESGIAEYRGRNVSSLSDIAIMERAVRQSLTVERLSRRGVDPAVVQEATTGISLQTLRISRRGATSESGTATFFLGYAMALILYIVTLAYGITVMRSVVQEKQDRVIELLISSLNPFQLMLGKVFGVGGVGLLQMLIWTSVGALTMKYRTSVLTMLGVPQAAVAQFRMPTLSLDMIGLVLVYFLLGYLFYSALFAMVGAAVNSETEAGQAQQPVMMLLVVSLLVSIGALGNASGPIGFWGSIVPFSAPIVMPVRMATSDVNTGEVLMSLALMVVSTALVIWFAGRVYRIGILMYGKRPTIKELFRWARQS